MERKDNALDLAHEIMSLKKMINRGYTSTDRYRELLTSVTDRVILQSFKIAKGCRLVPEEELSGFIIYLYGKIQSIIDSYEVQDGRSFETYLYVSLRYKASNYMSSVRRFNRMRRAYINFTYPMEAEFELVDMENKDQNDNAANMQMIAVSKQLVQIFTSSIVWQKRFFIFLCGVLPFIDSKLLETICVNMAIDIDQTLYIRQLLLSRHLDSSEKESDSREYIAERRNFYHCRVIHLESELFINGESIGENEANEIKKSITYNRMQYRKTVQALKNKQNRIGYGDISEVLGVKRGSIGSSIFIVRKKLQEIASGQILQSNDTASEENRKDLSVFHPFTVFKIKKDKKKPAVKRCE